ncbi:Crp/Fnr family transcriptional regulator [Sphaerisporangium sp. TRM90804]|uniref:Crp/Fnr family transcriptional regulator n=1 Tax=Sphaerisporangium sp. TRM90804 TaxID=3031113 RepID=UPI00244B3814|nr:Crp/Fnr family transcriptional regulator [Sphaerisporangium sp. TRM90804]MDH2424190.1 Crp/Fnr family transcriptional regulator [Sphaerisporangium sp. TRM90804]
MIGSEPGRRVIRKVGNWPRGSLLGSLPEPVRDEMLGLGRPRQFTTGETLILEGDRSTDVFLLVDACVKVTANTESGRVALLGIRVGGDLVGEFAALDGLPRGATVAAAGPCLVQLISQDAFLGFLQRSPEAALAVNRAVVNKVRWTTRRRVEFGTFSTPTRLARVLVELAWSYGEPVREGIMIGVALTQPELAALVGAADPTVHKTLTLLRRQGVLGTGYRRIVVHDMRRLQAFAGLGDNPLDYEVPA